MKIGRTAFPDRLDVPETMSVRLMIAIMAALIVLGTTGHRLHIERLFTAPTGQSGGVFVLAGRFFPPQISERQPITPHSSYVAAHLPLFAHLEREEIVEEKIDPVTMAVVQRRSSQTVLVEPFGYAQRVATKTVETIEIALWGTVLALTIGLPLALFGARSTLSVQFIGSVFRAATSILRGLPELITALLLVTVYGFGPIAGVLALGLHGAGFIGKFFGEEIENADKKPQEALIATGCSRFAVLRFAVLPQVLPAYVGYAVYILDRNVRMATVIGLVGAGGIGQELKGRVDLYEYDRVGTILIAILIVVALLEVLSARLRNNLM